MTGLDKKLSNGFAVILQLLAVMYAVQLASVLTDVNFKYYGIHPRDYGSLWFLITAPFIHSGWLHLLNNTLCFVIFSGLCLMKGVGFYLKASLFIIILGGFLVWLFGRQATHIGASGWIFGLWGLIIATAWFERSFINIVIATGVIVFYGGMAFGVLPLKEKISFESHLFGVIAGVAAAALVAQHKKRASE